MRTRRIIALLTIAVVFVAALVACGGVKKHEVPANAIAVVGNQVVLRSQYETALEQKKLEYKQAKQAFPAVGSTDYETVRQQIVSSLVLTAAVMQKAADMGVKVTTAEIDANLQQGIAQQFQGNLAKYKAWLKSQHMTEQQLREGIRQGLVGQQVKAALGQDIKVSSSEIKKYYDEHKSSYQVSESRTVSHILVKSKTLVDTIYQQLKAGAKFATLAKKYSTDSSKASGGDLGLMEKKLLVPPFAKALFALKTGALSKPVKTQFGWHVILATGPIIPPHLKSLKEATSDIRQVLLSDKQTKAVNDWVSKAKKSVAASTSYAVGFAPPKPSSSTVGTTTTG